MKPLESGCVLHDQSNLDLMFLKIGFMYVNMVYYSIIITLET